MRSVFMALAACAAFSGAAFAADFARPVTEDYWEGDITWTSLGKAYVFRWTVTAVDGQLAVCGAGQYLDPTTRKNTAGVMRTATIHVAGKQILKDMSFFAKVKKGQDLMTAKATCRPTGAREPRGRYDIELRTPTTWKRF